LASDDASFITGETMPVDGGRHAMCPRWNKTWIILSSDLHVSKNVSCRCNQFKFYCVVYLHILD
jgi:hypothetical protein